MTETARLRMALVGCGAISDWHVSGIKGSGAPIDIVAVIDTDLTRARTLGTTLGVPAFASMASAFAAVDVQAVDLMVPHHVHEAVATEAFEAKKHVLLEKPMATSLDACARILAAADRAQTVFAIAENAQYWPEVLAARALITEGAIGSLVTGRAATFFPPMASFYGGDHAWRLDSAAAGGGIALDTCSHWLRPMRMVMGEVDEVCAVFGRPFGKMQGESLVRALLKFRSGLVASFDAMLTTAPGALDAFFRFDGDAGAITIDPLGRVTLFDATRIRGERIGEHAGYLASYAGEMADFASAVLTGQPLAADAAYSIGEVRIALAMARSAESGRFEKVNS